MSHSPESAIPDALGWDVANWSRALSFWETELDRDLSGVSALELGAGQAGGLSLWLALKGASVTCSDYHPRYADVSDRAKKIHVDYGISSRITYRRIDARDLPFESTFDIVAYRSMLGGIVREGDLSIADRVVAEVENSLRPGGILLFAENLCGTWLHALMRRRFGAGREGWRYFTLAEVLALHGSFSTLNYATFGTLGLFGQSKRQWSLLGALDRVILDRLTPRRARYLVAGIAKKGIA